MNEEKKAFVAMSFKPEYKQVYVESIKPAFAESGYDCFRVDEKHGPRNIPEQIIRSIIDADTVLADISEDSPNVFYELGFSLSIGKKTIVIASHDSNIPFYASHYRVIYYDKTDEGLELLHYRIIEAIKQSDSYEEKLKVFAIMDFDPKYDQVYRESVKPAFAEKDYECTRLCQVKEEDILPQIRESVTHSDVVLVDISENNPNVFYGLALSHSVGSKTITINSSEKMPFDIGSYRAISYKNTDEGRKVLYDSIIGNIEELDREERMMPRNLIQDAGRFFFNRIKETKKKLKELTGEIARTKEFNKFIETGEFCKQDNTSVVKQIIAHIMERKGDSHKTIIVSLCGPGAIGKSSFSRAIKTNIEKDLKLSASILSTDAYMMSRPERFDKSLKGFDPRANDLKKFCQDIENLVENKKIFIRPYSHETGEHKEEVGVEPADILIIEGIFSFYPEMIYKISGISRLLKYFIYADEFKAKELKFISDVKERGHSIREAFRHAEPEYSAFETYILPHIKLADYIIRVDGYWRYNSPEFQNINSLYERGISL